MMCREILHSGVFGRYGPLFTLHETKALRLAAPVLRHTSTGAHLFMDQFDCQACGACCSYKATWPILKRDRSDAVNIPPELVRDDLPLLRCTGARCNALSGTVGQNVGCTIYEARPAACRAFKAGSALCIEARAALGLYTPSHQA